MAITPDTKDWTWVLERPCPECGLDTRHVDRAHLPRLVRETAEAWRVVLRRPAVRARPDPDRWSDLEYACHVRDVFRVFEARLQRILTEDGPRFPNWDQDATAVEERYAEQDPVRVADELLEAAEVLARRFEAVPDEQWQRVGFRSDGAVFTVESLGRYLIHDPVHHLGDVTRTAP